MSLCAFSQRVCIYRKGKDKRKGIENEKKRTDLIIFYILFFMSFHFYFFVLIRHNIYESSLETLFYLFTLVFTHLSDKKTYNTKSIFTKKRITHKNFIHMHTHHTLAQEQKKTTELLTPDSHYI